MRIAWSSGRNEDQNLQCWAFHFYNEHQKHPQKLHIPTVPERSSKALLCFSSLDSDDYYSYPKCNFTSFLLIFINFYKIRNLKFIKSEQNSYCNILGNFTSAKSQLGSGFHCKPSKVVRPVKSSCFSLCERKAKGFPLQSLLRTV
jgi:hypothetical protein